MSTVEPLLVLENLHTEIDVRDGVVHPLSGVSLSVRQGETLGIVGESGCGKTMTALSIMGLLPSGGRVSEGKILLDSRNLVTEKPSEVRKLRGTEIGMIFQDPLTSLNPTMKIGVQVGEPLRVHEKMSKTKTRKRVIEVLRRVGMPRPESIAEAYPHQLSGGMRQRAMIAMALVCKPKLLIADEPTTALDVTTQKQILDLIDEMRDEFQMAVILITHDLGVVAGHTDRVAVMYGGKVVETASTRELFAAPTHRYTNSLLSALPERALESGGRLVAIAGAPPSLREPIRGCSFAPRCRWVKDECWQAIPLLEPLYRNPTHLVACINPAANVSSAPTNHKATSDGDKLAESCDADPTSSSGTVLVLNSVSKEYETGKQGIFKKAKGKVSAVDRVSLTVKSGSTYGLVGESGCGKSTLGRLAAALEPTNGGTVTVDDQQISNRKGRSAKAIHRDVQMMFQDSYAAMDPRMRIDEILSEPVKIQGTLDKAQLKEKILSIMQAVGLPADTMNRYPHEFSGGQLQRIGLARSLMLEPDLIVADEPVSALDVSVQAQVLNLMKDLQAEMGLSYLFISHDLAVVQYMSDQIGVMYLGRMVEEGPADEVARNPRHPYTKILIDSIPIPDPEHQTVAGEEAITGEPPSALNPPSGCRFRTRCPLATEKCLEEPPLVGEIHKVACHYPLR